MVSSWMAMQRHDSSLQVTSRAERYTLSPLIERPRKRDEPYPDREREGRETLIEKGRWSAETAGLFDTFFVETITVELASCVILPCPLASVRQWSHTTAPYSRGKSKSGGVSSAELHRMLILL